MRRFSFLLFIATTLIGASTHGARADLFEQGGADPNLAGYTAVGYGTSGTFTISSDTTVPDGFTLYQTGSTFTTSSAAFLGFTDDITGTINVTGSGAQWTTENYAYLGNNSGSTGIVNVENGGLWTAASYVCVADNTGSTGTINIGSGSQMTVADQLYIGNYSGAVGTINLTGSGAQLTTTGYAYLGYTSGAIGIVTIENGGLWTASNNVYVAANNNSTGTVTIGSGSQMTAAGDFYVGDYSGAVGTVDLTGSGAQLTVTGRSDIGATAGSTGSISVSNGGIFTSGETWVGGNGNGSLSVSSGGQVINTDTFFGVAAFSSTTGTVTVDGAGSKLTIDGTAGDGAIEMSGTNSSIQVTNGGEIDSGDVYLDAASASAQGTATISGTGSLWKAGIVLVGESGVVTLTVADGGKLQADGYIGLGYENTTDVHSGTLQIGDGGAPGTISASEIVGGLDGDGNGIVVFDHNSSSYYFTDDSTASGTPIPIQGSTQVVVDAGTTTLNSSGNTYTDGTQINGGTLIVGSNSALGTGAVNVAGGTLQINSGYQVTNTINLSGGNLAQEVTTGTQFSGLHNFTSAISSGTPTIAQFLGGQSSGSATITGGFSKLSLALNDGVRVSDVLSLSGVSVVNATTGQTDTFVLQLKLDPSLLSANTYLGWLDPSTNLWTNAVDGNIGGTSDFVSGAYNPDDPLGTYGVDITDGTVWAVLDHNSSFAVVTPATTTAPEPSTWLLLGLGLGGLVFLRRKTLHDPKT